MSSQYNMPNFLKAFEAIILKLSYTISLDKPLPEKDIASICL